MIEITRDLEWVYRISPNDPLLIERKPNKFGARWTWYAHRDTSGETKAMLLSLARRDDGKVTTEVKP